MESKVMFMSALQNIYSKHRLHVGLYRKHFTHFFSIVYNRYTTLLWCYCNLVMTLNMCSCVIVARIGYCHLKVHFPSESLLQFTFYDWGSEWHELHYLEAFLFLIYFFNHCILFFFVNFFSLTLISITFLSLSGISNVT